MCIRDRNVTGSVKRKERFRTYIKVPELAMFLREITDYRTADMINLDAVSYTHLDVYKRQMGACTP